MVAIILTIMATIKRGSSAPMGNYALLMVTMEQGRISLAANNDYLIMAVNISNLRLGIYIYGHKTYPRPSSPSVPTSQSPYKLLP